MVSPMAPLCALLWALLSLCSANAADAAINTGGGIRGIRTLSPPDDCDCIQCYIGTDSPSASPSISFQPTGKGKGKKISVGKGMGKGKGKGASCAELESSCDHEQLCRDYCFEAPSAAPSVSSEPSASMFPSTSPSMSSEPSGKGVGKGGKGGKGKGGIGKCGKGGKGGVATDILERFCEVCTAEFAAGKDYVGGKAEVYEVNSPTASPVTSNQTPSPSPPVTSSSSGSVDKSSEPTLSVDIGPKAEKNIKKVGEAGKVGSLGSPAASPVPSNSPSPVPSNLPSPVPSNSPSPVPSNSPSPVPSNPPSPVPSNPPTPTPPNDCDCIQCYISTDSPSASPSMSLQPTGKGKGKKISFGKRKSKGLSCAEMELSCDHDVLCQDYCIAAPSAAPSISSEPSASMFPSTSPSMSSEPSGVGNGGKGGKGKGGIGKCGKGGKGGVATDSLERFCEVCTAKYPGSEDAAEGSTAAVSAATKAMATTDPSSLSTGQIVGIAVGGFVAFCTLIRLIKCCCSRKKLD